MSVRKKLSLFLAIVFALLINGATLEKRPYLVLENPYDASSPSPPGGASPADVDSAPAPAAAATPEASTTPATTALLATPATLTAPSVITAPPTAPLSGSAGCKPYGCNLFYQYVNVYYWPGDSPNTACLSARPNITSSPPDIQNIQSPSVYIIFPSISANDGCSQIGQTFADLTTSLAPGALSTIGLDSSTYSFNFGDLPCPPADVGWDPSKGPYAPLLAPPDFLFHLDPAFATCIPGASQGIDPYTTLTTASADSNVGAAGCGLTCKRAKRALEHAHPMPWAPRMTAEPRP